MKTRNYRNGKFTARAYCKNAGYGWEVGFTVKGRPIFIGNFVHIAEANQWWNTMNREIRTFCKKYRVTPTFPRSSYLRFLSSHLHAKYYQFLDRVFATHTRTYNRAVTRDLRTFRRIARNTSTGPKQVFLKAA